jgi:hypothetical protein
MPAKPRTELKVEVENKPGELTKVLAVLAKSGVNALAFCGYAVNGGGVIMVVPDHDGKATKALEASGYKVTSGPVLAVQTAAGQGAGAKLAKKLSDAGINVDYAYASSIGSGQGMAIFRVADIEKAIKALA